MSNDLSGESYPQKDETVLHELLNKSFSTYSSSSLKRKRLVESDAARRQYLTSLEKQLSPYLEIIVGDTLHPAPEFISEVEDELDELSGMGRGQWSVQVDAFGSTSLEKVSLHSVKFPGCLFYILVQKVPIAEPGRANLSQRMLLITRAPKQLNSVFTNWFQAYFDIKIEKLSFPQNFLHRFIDDYIQTRMRESNDVGTGIEIEFSIGLETLRRISITVEGEDVRQLYLAHSNSFLDTLFEHMKSSTGILCKGLQISRVSCGAGVLSSEGRIKFMKQSFLTEMPNGCTFLSSWLSNILDVSNNFTL
ncbi:kinetochore complex Sim4 subunit Fta1-domain-containing protein [Dipodascopsis uninucleata]